MTSLTLFSRKNNLLGSSLSFCIEKINIITLVTIFALITFIFIYLPFNLGVFLRAIKPLKMLALDFYKTNSVTIFLKYFCFLLIILFLFEKFELTSTKKFFLIVFLCSILFFSTKSSTLSILFY